MKLLTQILFNSLLLLNATILFAQEPIRGQDKNRLKAIGYRLEEEKNQGIDNRKTELILEDQIGQRAEITTNYELRTANCDNLGQDLSYHLMMNPATIEEEIKAVGEALGVFGKGEIITAEATGIGRGEIVNTISSSSPDQVLRLRGGGPKKFQPTGGLKSTGDTSDEEEKDANPDVESEDTQPMSGQVNKYLRDEIINNIYTECLAEVAKLSLGGRVTAENLAKEEAEWAAAAQAAEYSKGKIERAFEKAEWEIDVAKSISDEAKRNIRELEKAPKPVSATEQAIAAANLAYEKAYAAHAASDYKAKKLAGELAEARVETANAVLHAITVRKGTQHATEAEAGLETAKEAELEALKAVQAAMTDVKAKLALMNTAEANLNDAKRMVHGISPTSPMTAAQKVAMKGIEKYKTAAETAEASAIDAELRASVAKGKIREMNFEREIKAYHDAEEAWMEAGEGYKTALAKVNEVGLDDEELTAALASAEVHQATWRAHARWAKARQVDQMVAVPGASLDQLINAEAAWANVVEGYNIAVDQSTQAKLKCGELTVS
ncbi:MAG TPA: hypothetical protein VJK54_06030, partial [Chthoniobacterales bacterium]|nr:hypothetical protein [Chthoniobacterales bacterium]